jgi:hypothetical protein
MARGKLKFLVPDVPLAELRGLQDRDSLSIQMMERYPLCGNGGVVNWVNDDFLTQRILSPDPSNTVYTDRFDSFREIGGTRAYLVVDFESRDFDTFSTDRFKDLLRFWVFGATESVSFVSVIVSTLGYIGRILNEGIRDKYRVAKQCDYIMDYIFERLAEKLDVIFSCNTSIKTIVISTVPWRSATTGFVVTCDFVGAVMRFSTRLFRSEFLWRLLFCNNGGLFVDSSQRIWVVGRRGGFLELDVGVGFASFLSNPILSGEFLMSFRDACRRFCHETGNRIVVRGFGIQLFEYCDRADIHRFPENVLVNGNGVDSVNMVAPLDCAERLDWIDIVFKNGYSVVGRSLRAWFYVLGLMGYVSDGGMFSVKKMTIKCRNNRFVPDWVPILHRVYSYCMVTIWAPGMVLDISSRLVSYAVLLGQDSGREGRLGLPAGLSELVVGNDETSERGFSLWVVDNARFDSFRLQFSNREVGCRLRSFICPRIIFEIKNVGRFDIEQYVRFFCRLVDSVTNMESMVVRICLPRLFSENEAMQLSGYVVEVAAMVHRENVDFDNTLGGGRARYKNVDLVFQFCVSDLVFELFVL